MSDHRLLRLVPLLLLLPLAGCELAGDILEFGFWVGIVAMVAVLLVIWLVVRAFRGATRRRPPA